jgi:uncharacterized membrane protein YhaH (DUF805 family)
VLFNFIAANVAVIIDAIAGWDMSVNSNSGIPNWGPCYLTYTVAILLPALAVAVRRLHDLGKSGWWLLIGLIPIVGGIWLIVLYCKKGESRRNRYGVNPKYVIKQSFPEHRREKSIAVAFIVGAAVSLTYSMVGWIQQNAFTNMHFQFWLIPTLFIMLRLLFGAFYHPAGDSRKTAKRRDIAFVLLALSMLIPVIWNIPSLIKMLGNHDISNLIWVNTIAWLLANLALLALAVLLLFKSERKNIEPVAVSIIVLTIARVVIVLVETFMLDFPSYSYSFEIILNIAYILLAVHCLQEEEEEEEEDESLIPPESVAIKITVSTTALIKLSPEDFEKPVDKELLDQWKENVAKQKSAAIILAVLWGVGMLLLIVLRGMVGVLLFFALAIPGAVNGRSKTKKVKESFSRLGISESELKQALDVCSRKSKL